MSRSALCAASLRSATLVSLLNEVTVVQWQSRREQKRTKKNPHPTAPGLHFGNHQPTGLGMCGAVPRECPQNPPSGTKTGHIVTAVRCALDSILIRMARPGFRCCTGRGNPCRRDHRSRAGIHLPTTRHTRSWRCAANCSACRSARSCNGPSACCCLRPAIPPSTKKNTQQARDQTPGMGAEKPTEQSTRVSWSAVTPREGRSGGTNALSSFRCVRRRWFSSSSSRMVKAAAVMVERLGRLCVGAGNGTKHRRDQAMSTTRGICPRGFGAFRRDNSGRFSPRIGAIYPRQSGHSSPRIGGMSPRQSGAFLHDNPGHFSKTIRSIYPGQCKAFPQDNPGHFSTIMRGIPPRQFVAFPPEEPTHQQTTFERPGGTQSSRGD